MSNREKILSLSREDFFKTFVCGYMKMPAFTDIMAHSVNLAKRQSVEQMLKTFKQDGYFIESNEDIQEIINVALNRAMQVM